jgi:hypothetical protein
MINWLEEKTEIKKAKTFISKRTENFLLKNFFENVLSQFQKELQLLADSWYCYSEDGKCGTEEIFALIERSYVGLFNNAVIRCFPNDAVLQEYSVHLGGRNYVRCDYLVKHQAMNILFEAKQRTFDGKKYNDKETEMFLSPFVEKGMKYFNAEEKYYVDTTFVSSLVFEWVRYSEHLKQVLMWSNEDDTITDFYSLYHTDNAGLMVYGNLKKVK